MAGEGAIGWRSRRLDAGRIFPPPMTDSARLAAALDDRRRVAIKVLRPDQALLERVGLPEDLRR